MKFPASLLLLVPTFALAADKPRDELLRLVPPDTAVCLLVQDLREQAKSVSESPFAAWAAAKYAPRLTAMAEYKSLKQFEAIIAEQVGVGFAELRDDIFGDAFAFAYRPALPEKPETEQGVFLLKARDAKKLRTLIEKMNALQTASGEVKAVAERTHAGANYFQRKKSDGKDEFYLLRDGLFAFSGQEPGLKAVLERLGSTAPPAVGASLAKLGHLDAFLVAWVNPRSLDAEWAGRASRETDPATKAGFQQVGRIWDALDGASFALRVTPAGELSVQANATFNPKLVPKELQPFLAPAREAVRGTIPNDSFFAARASVAPTDLLNLIASFAPTSEAAKVRDAIAKAIGPIIGKANVAPLLAGVGPSWSLSVVAPTTGKVPQAAIAVALADGPAGKSAERLTGFWLQLFQVDYNTKHDAQLETRDDATASPAVKYLASPSFPAGFAPGFALAERHFVFGSSPGAVRAFRASTNAEEPAAFVVQLEAAKLADYLTAHANDVADWLADAQERDVADVRSELDNIRRLLEPFKTIRLRTTHAPGRVGLHLDLKLIHPLTK